MSRIRAISRGVRKDLNAVARQTHGMMARLKIGPAIFKNVNRAAGNLQSQVHHPIRITDAISRFRCNEYSCARVRGKSEERLDEPTVIKCIRRQLTEAIETIDEDPLNIRVANRFRDFRSY